MLGKQGKKVWTGCIWVRRWASDGCCKHGNGPWGFHKRHGIFWL